MGFASWGSAPMGTASWGFVPLGSAPMGTASWGFVPLGSASMGTASWGFVPMGTAGDDLQRVPPVERCHLGVYLVIAVGAQADDPQ